MKRNLIYLIVVCCSILGAIGQIMFAKGSQTINLSKPIELLTNYSLIVGFVCYGIATVVYIIMLQYGNVSVLYPIIALSYVWVLFLSAFLLGQPLTTFKMLGVALIIIGVGAIVR